MTIKLTIPYLVVGVLGLTACSSQEDRVDVDGAAPSRRSSVFAR